MSDVGSQTSDTGNRKSEIGGQKSVGGEENIMQIKSAKELNVYKKGL